MRIGIVNDSMLAVEALRRAIYKSAHSLAWVAHNGQEAVTQCAADRPDLILMDLFMPVMDGVESTRRIMAATPCAILIVTGNEEEHVSKIFQCLGAGALDVVKTPTLDAGDQLDDAALHAKISVMARLIKGAKVRVPEAGGRRVPRSTQSLIAIGSSAGGPSALATILQDLPRDFPAAVVVVQHIDSKFALSLANWLDGDCALPVRLAREGDCPQNGVVLLAGTGDHLLFTDSQTLGYSEAPLAGSYRPSVDVFFHSVARYWRGKVAALLLTGMGRDGALGLKAVREAGGITIAQDEESCVVYGMPKAAAAIDAAQEILPLKAMAPRIVEIVAGFKPAPEVSVPSP